MLFSTGSTPKTVISDTKTLNIDKPKKVSVPKASKIVKKKVTESNKESPNKSNTEKGSWLSNKVKELEGNKDKKNIVKIPELPVNELIIFNKKNKHAANNEIRKIISSKNKDIVLDEVN